MTKKPKEISLLPSPGSSFGTSGQWKDAWEKVAAETQKTMAQYMQESGVSPYPWLGTDLFSPEKVMTVFTQEMQAMSQQIERSEGGLDNNFVDIQAFLNATMGRFQKEDARWISSSTTIEKEAPEWDEAPFFFLLQQSYLLNVQFFKEVSSRSHKLDPLVSRKLASYTQHLVDVLSLNPEELLRNLTPSDIRHSTSPALESDQWEKDRDDASKKAPNWPVTAFQLGKNIGATPGKIVFQNSLFQLIQYEALTSTVAKRPLFIVPPWMNKYYIFDIDPENSFVQWALRSGLTVFVMSWVNPGQRHLQKTMTNYVVNGIKAALDQVCHITGETEVNAVGYCAGGTLLGCLMAYLEAKKDHRIRSATFVAAPFDFSKVDELGIYQFARQSHKQEDEGDSIGYWEAHHMLQVFNLLRANDLIWSSDANHYLLGQIPFPFEMLHWTCDGLRMPPKVHSVYFRKMLIENSLMKRGSLSIDGIPIDLRNMSTPLFVMASHEDQIAPWRSVYALTQVAKTASRKFILGASGHVTGVFAPPSSQRYHYWMADDLPEKPDDWLGSAKKQSGSWWHEWRQWLSEYEGEKVPARAIPKDCILEDAPGCYAKG